MDDLLFSKPKPSSLHKNVNICRSLMPEDRMRRKLTAADLDIKLGSSNKAILFAQLEKDIEYRIICNDGTKQSMTWLIVTRNIFHHELIQMPENYISRLIFDPTHFTLIMIRNGSIIGGICFRPFRMRKFAELAFCAVLSSEQIQGYGTHLMTTFKSYLQSVSIEHILTYADNTALGYFKRQGFTRYSTLPPTDWRHYIKDYQGATLIHCSVDPQIDYLHIYDIIDKQIELVSDQLPYVLLQRATSWPVKMIRGIEIGEVPQMDAKILMKIIVSKASLHSRAWPFLKPICAENAPQYCQLIKRPMDFQTLGDLVDSGHYKTMKEFEEDLNLIFLNCYEYNGEDSVYSRSAKELEVYVKSLLKACPEKEAAPARRRKMR